MYIHEQILSMTSDGLKLRATIIKTGFFGTEEESAEEVVISWPNSRKVTSDDQLKDALMVMLRACGLDAETAEIMQVC